MEVNPYLLFYSPAPGSNPAGSVSQIASLAERNRVSYPVQVPAGFRETPYFNQLIDELEARYPEQIRVVHRGPDPGYWIYSVDYRRLVP